MRSIKNQVQIAPGCLIRPFRMSQSHVLAGEIVAYCNKSNAVLGCVQTRLGTVVKSFHSFEYW